MLFSHWAYERIEQPSHKKMSLKFNCEVNSVAKFQVDPYTYLHNGKKLTIPVIAQSTADELG